MTTKRKAISSGSAIKINGSPHEGSQWEFTVHTRSAARRFECLIQQCVFCPSSSALQVHELSGLLAARLVCLDGIRPDALPHLVKSASMPYRCGDHVALEWHEGPSQRIERRFLHPLTLHIWPRQPKLRSVQDVSASRKDPIAAAPGDGELILEPPINELQIVDLVDPLLTWLRENNFYREERDPLLALASDQLAWLSPYLPGPLFSHCSGMFVLTAIDRAAWARSETHLAVSLGSNLETHDSPAEFQTDTLLDSLGEVSGTQYDENLLKSALEILQTRHPSGIDGLTKRHWIEGLLKLPLNLSSNSPSTVVLVGWIAYMCEFGTVGSKNPAASTIRQYASSVLLSLGKDLRDFEAEPDNWDLINLDAVFKNVFNSKTNGMRAATAAALRSFQSYLEEVFDTEQFFINFTSTRGEKEDSESADVAPSGTQVRANVLWPHEIDWCQKECTNALDLRVGQIAKVMLAVARECAVRYQDLSRLTTANISFGNDALGAYCQIEVVRHARRGRLKTDSSQRRLTVRNTSSLRILRDWVEVRSRETGNLSAYFFGNKNADKERYRPAAVQALLNKLVKLVSGCPRMRFHDLRHTVVSNQVAEVLKSCVTVDINPLYAVSTAAGHVLPLTTLRSYSHLYEDSLRLWIDFGMQTALHTNSDDQARVLRSLSGKSTPLHGNSLIQAARRLRIDSTHHWQRQMEEVAVSIPLPLATDPFEWTAPATTARTSAVKRQVSALEIADALGRLQNGAAHDSLARLTGIPFHTFEDLVARLDAWVARLYRRHFPRTTHHLVSMPPLAERLQRMRVDASACGHSFWSKFSNAMDTSISREVMAAAVSCWEEHGRGLHFPLLPNAAGRPLLQLLRYADLDRGHIRAVVQARTVRAHENEPIAASSSAYLEKSSEVIKNLNALFSQELKFNARVELAPWRPERPPAYLRINPHAEADRTNPAAEKTAALRGWLLTAKALLLLDELEGKPNV